MALVLGRKLHEKIVIQVPGQPDIVIEVTDVHRDRCRLGITAPREVKIFREELLSQTTPTEVQP